jgi:hypothetical protein
LSFCHLQLRRPRGAILGALIAAPLAALAPVLAGCGGSGGSQPAPSAVRTTPLQSIFEADVQMLADPAATLDLLRRFGVDRVRVFVPWGALGTRAPLAPDALSAVAPKGFDATDPAQYPADSWAPYDAIVRDAAARGIGLDFTLAGPAPVWATQPGEPPGPIGV